MLPFLTWLVEGGIGPALVGLPVTWAATDLAKVADRWFRRLRRSDGLSSMIRAAVGSDVRLTNVEFVAIRRLLTQESTWVVVGRGTVEDLASMIASCLPGRASADSLAAGKAIAAGLLEFAVRELEPEWFRQVLFARMDRLQADQARALDRLPPGPADETEVKIYLARLISWLNSDPWPEDARFGGSALTPSAIERKLRIITSHDDEEKELDADDLAKRCTRLVVLGGPGSGKTWLARRAVRLCAEAALDALTTGTGLDEVELPLYTTCARLAAAPLNEGIRSAIVSGALGLLPDLGNTRILDSLRTLFEERNAPTLLVADSLDEARAADYRLRQADTLPPDWRIVLTTRSGSWNRQLAIDERGLSQQIGFLQPLRYPDDVEPFITSWFADRPDWAAELAAQIRDREALQQAATVPLLLAFYCIVGGDQPLPDSRADLYAKVIRRMLTGRWRGASNSPPDPNASLETLREWAWSAAHRNPVSGIGDWADEFDTPYAMQNNGDSDALNHVAVPLGPPDPDTGTTRRRFVHRSIQEHLVAEYVAFGMTADETAAELLNHLWYDTDWEYTAPAALVMHTRRDQILIELIRHVTGNSQSPWDLSTVDGCWEIRQFLARVAQESGEAAWSPEAAEVIGGARLDLAMSRHDNFRQVMNGDWPTSNRLIFDSLLRLPARQSKSWDGLALADSVARLASTAKDRARARKALLRLLARQTDPFTASQLAGVVAELNPTDKERARAQVTLLRFLFRQLITNHQTEALGDGFAQLTLTAEERVQAREALLSRVTRATIRADIAAGLALVVARLDLASQKSAREALLSRLVSQTDHASAWLLTATIVRLHPTAEERAQSRKTLLARLATTTEPRTVGMLAIEVAQLDPAAQERAQALETVLSLLTGNRDLIWDWMLVKAVARLAWTAEQRTPARETLLTLLATTTDPIWAGELAEAIAQLDPTAEDRASVRETMLGLADSADSQPNSVIAQLAWTAEERAHTRETMLSLLTSATRPKVCLDLAVMIARLDPTEEQRKQTRETLLRLLGGATLPGDARELANMVTRLDATAEQRKQTRERLLGLLTGTTDPWVARVLADAIAQLDPTAEEQMRARETLLGLLASTTDPSVARQLADTVAGLAPTVDDIGDFGAWPIPPTQALLAAVCRNSRFSNWLNALPLLSGYAATLTGFDRKPITFKNG